MIEYLGNKVKIYLNNGQSAEGVMLRCDENEIVLRSMHNNDLLFINNNKNNISFVRVFVDSTEQEIPKISAKRLEQKPPELDHVEPKQIDRVTKLADLKVKQIQETRKNISEFLNKRIAQIPQEQVSNYVYPNFSK